MFGLLVWAKRQVGINDEAITKIRIITLCQFMNTCTVILVFVGRQ